MHPRIVLLTCATLLFVLADKCGVDVCGGCLDTEICVVTEHYLGGNEFGDCERIDIEKTCTKVETNGLCCTKANCQDGYNCLGASGNTGRGTCM
ncbi:MAG: hypothetical protein J3R72DRAFT_451536 [Linnemannia gamsii]|nr:MAG: hypothetical protein J3R72DRAFT_451536 [Linnemannia gamsii]